jgi:hypothetical protein
MLNKFKMIFYAIMVTLATVLVLPVNAAELQLVIHKGKPHRGEALSPKMKRKRPTPQQRRDQYNPLAERERERVEAGHYECAAQLERIFYEQLQPRMNTSLSQHDLRWNEDTQRRQGELRPILNTVQDMARQARLDVNSMAGQYSKQDKVALQNIRTMGVLQEITSSMTRALEVDSQRTGRLNDVRADALRDIEHIKETLDSWLAGDGPEACGMSPRQ